MTAPLAGAAALNAPLIGVAGGRHRLETPAAVLDLDLFEANLARLAETCRAAGLAMRPHAKSHKCAEIAKRQIAAGAVGVCCAKPGELLALLDAGVPDLLLSAPVASAAKIDAIARAASRARITVAVDRDDLVGAYADATRRHGTRLDVLVDLDVGLGRSGVATGADAVRLAALASNRPGLRYRGVQAYQGRVQHVDDVGERRAGNRAMGAALAPLVHALREGGLAPEIVSGGGTGSHAIDAELALFTEVQPGSYALMDEGYASVDTRGAGPEFGFALRVALTVVNHSAAGFAIVDGGSKSFALDGPPPRVFQRETVVGRIEWCGDEFGRVLPAPGAATLPVGAVVECTVPHCDPTMNLHDALHVVQGDRLVALWPVEGRGRAD